MAFHKRHFTMEKITNKAIESDWQSFDIWLTRPDSVTLDNDAKQFYHNYITSDEDVQKLIFQKIKDDAQ